MIIELITIMIYVIEFNSISIKSRYLFIIYIWLWKIDAWREAERERERERERGRKGREKKREWEKPFFNSNVKPEIAAYKNFMPWIPYILLLFSKVAVNENAELFLNTSKFCVVETKHVQNLIGSCNQNWCISKLIWRFRSIWCNIYWILNS